MSTMVVRMQEKGQVTIPHEVRQKLNLKKGDLVTFVITQEGVLIKPVEVVVAAALDQIGKALREKGISLDDYIERGRTTRGELIEDEYHLSESKPE